MKAHVRWERGGEAELTHLATDAVTLASTTPSPPGSRPSGTLVDGGHCFRMKVHASRKQADGTFALEGRLIDATRDLRAKLVDLLRADSAV